MVGRTHAPADGRVRVTVASQGRRVDLVLPAAVPVAELLPELARSVGVLQPTTVHGGHRLVTATGRELVGGASLADQDIVDGNLLVVVTGAQEPARLYDDVAEAMADVVARELEPRDPDFGRRAALTTAALLAALGSLALVVVGSVVAGASAAGLALALTAGAVVLSRVRRDTGAAVGVAGGAVVHAAVAGFVLAPHSGSYALPLACAGAAAVITGLVCLLGLAESRSLAVPPVVVGAVLMSTAAVTWGTRIDPAVILTTVLTIVVMTGSLVPSLALGVTGTMTDQLSPGPALPVDLDRVRADARLAHKSVIAASATTGLLLLVGAPLAVSLGPSGAALAVTCSLVVVLRTRRHQAGAQVKVGLVSGATGLLSAATSALWLHWSWRPTVAPVLATTGVAVLLAAALLSGGASVRRDRLCDLVESAALLVAPPLLVVATGAFAAIRG
ncbi:MAG TPA: EsaB/YukD family protein [Nocardioides sp.]|nr:EsaB/YukD family protein [Nocardioides sp.]